MSSSKKGAVKFFNEVKGFGFIKPEDGSADVFVHVTALGGLKALEKDQQVSFEVEEGGRGPQAVKVEVV